jgi:hypothetical protein
MNCFIVGNDDEYTHTKWELLFNASKKEWNNNPTLNGNFKDFINEDNGSREKVLILACHCHFDADQNERWFYYDQNPDFKLTRSEIEEIFWESTKCDRLYLWVLTCESANIDVWFNVKNESEKRYNNSKKKICCRVIAAECGKGKKIKMTDPYIIKMLECVVNTSGFSISNTSTKYDKGHLEYAVLNDGFDDPEEDDGYLVYGLKELLLDWIVKLEGKSCSIKDPTVFETFICWDSADTNGKFKNFQIHDHHVQSSNSQKRILIEKFHAKASRNSCSINVEKNTNTTLWTHLCDTGNRCLDDVFNKKEDTTFTNSVLPDELNDKQRRSFEFKKKYEEI